MNDPTLVGYWEFQGNADDASSFMNNGVLQGSPAFVPDELGAVNQAIFFDGATDWVNFGDDPSVRFSSGESFTLNVDARPLKPSGLLIDAYGDFLRYDDFDLSDGDEIQSRGVMLFRLRYYDAGFRVEFAVGQGPSEYSTILSTELPYDAWYSFTGVRDVDKDSMYIYVNGCIDTLIKDNLQISWNTNGQYLMCGKYQSIFSTNFYYGYMQSAHIFKKALNNLEVVELSGDESEFTNIDAAICEGENYLGYNQSGQYYLAYDTPEKCDSIVRLNLEVSPVYLNQLHVDICDGESYNGYTTSGLYTDSLISSKGCDSIVQLQLTVNPKHEITIQVKICKGEMYNGHFNSGFYNDTLQTTAGCDSIVNVYLNVYQVYTTFVQATICEGESYGNYTESGVYLDTLNSVFGCDSVIVLNLIVLPGPQTTELITLCHGETYAGHTTSGTYTDTLLAVNGCDSLVIIVLDILPVPQTQLSVGICEGEVYNGYVTSGTYIDTLNTYFGCDSIVQLQLSVSPKTTTQLQMTICGGESYNSHSASGFYTDNLISSHGCDSTVMLNLLVSELYVLDTVHISDCENALGIPAGTFRDTIFSESCDTIRTRIVKNDNLYIPNVFSPNDDGVNDFFEIYPSQTGLEIRKMLVFDRWGERVFEKNNQTEVRWDGTVRGKRLNPGVFTYMIEYTCGGSINRRSGTVTLVL